MKKNCAIVRDLLPNYIENLVSDETKSYIDNHISDCNDCKETLKLMKENNNDVEKIINNIEEKAEIKLIKKIKTRKLIIKIITIILLIIFLSYAVYFAVRFIPINSVRAKSYNKIQELKEMNNYKLTVEKIGQITDEILEKKITIYYYKDGKYKEENTRSMTFFYDNGEYIADGIIRNENTKTIYYSDGDTNIITKNAETGETNISEEKQYIEKGKIYEDIYSVIATHSKNLSSKISMLNGFNLREENYNNKNYYVLTYSYNGVNIKYEYWINKETMIIDRIFSQQEVPIYKNSDYKYNIFDTKYIIEPNVVKDEDVIISADK